MPSSEQVPYIYIPVNKETLHIIIPEQRDNYRHHHLGYNEKITEIKTERIPHPRNLRQRFRQRICPPCVQPNAAKPHNDKLGSYIRFFTFRLKCPFIINDAIDNSPVDGTRQGSIYIVDIKQPYQKNRYEKVCNGCHLSRKLRPQEHEEAAFLRNHPRKSPISLPLTKSNYTLPPKYRPS